MAIQILRHKVTLTDRLGCVVELEINRSVQSSIDLWCGELEAVEITSEDLGLLIQALKAFHNTGSFIVGE